jgi:hypothetical protein
LSLVLEGIEGRCRGAVRGPEMCDESRSDTIMCSRGTYWNWKNLLYRGIHSSDGTSAFTWCLVNAKTVSYINHVLYILGFINISQTRELYIRVYAQNKKVENFGRIEILPFCSKKRVCAKVILEEFPLYKYWVR